MHPLIVRFSLALAVASSLPFLTLAKPAAAVETAVRHNSMAAHYTLDVTVDDQRHVVDVRETVEAMNRTGVPLTSLVFNVTPRHFSGFAMGPVTVDGVGQQPKFDDVVMEVPLRSPLPPDTSAKIVMSFKETVPSPGNIRYGYSDGILALGNWFPVLAVYRQDGWDRHHYSNVGDPFFTETADYQVTVHADPHVVIAHTGAFAKYHDGQWEFHANDVRDFALAMSRHYESHSVDVDGTKITSYFLPQDKTGGLAALDYATQSFAWYVDHLGPYGYPSFEVAETMSHVSTDVGQEYPNLIFVASTQERQRTPPGGYLTYLVAHETGHQWFYGLVGNDQVRQPWLDEGLAVHLSYLFLKDRYPSEYFKQWSTLQSDYKKAVATWGQKTIDTTEADYTSDEEYFSLLYRESAIFLDRLRETMGTDNYFTFLRDYVATYRGQTATTREFLLLAERYAGRDLTSLYQEYFRPESYAPAMPTATATGAATATPIPSATHTPVPSPSPTVRLTPSPAATSTVVRKSVTTPSPLSASRATPSATPTSGSVGTMLGLVVVSGTAGLVLVGLLSFLLMRRS